MSTPDVQFEVSSPQRWQRMQVLLRLGVLLLMGYLKGHPGGFLLAFYWVLPVVAAISIHTHGPSGYPLQPGNAVLRALHWWNAFLAYMLCVSDRFPAREADLGSVRFEVTPNGSASVAQALLRLLTSLPELLAVIVLSWVAGLLAVVAAVSVLLIERVPASVLRFLRFYLQLQARWLVYHAALVATHPLLDSARLGAR